MGVVVDNVLLTESSRMVSLTNNVSSSEARLEKILENGHCASNACPPPKYKRRSVSAIRDFPPGCGRFASQYAVKKEAICVDSNGNSIGKETRSEEGLAVDGDSPDGNAFEIELERVVQSLISTQTTEHKNHMGSEEKEQEALLDQVGVQEQPNTDSAEPLFPDAELEKASKCEAADLFEDSIQPNIVAVKEATAPSGTQSQSSPICSLNDANENAIEKTMARKYPPRRIVSAVRDFPPFCGRNAARKEIVGTIMQSVKGDVPVVDTENSRVELSDTNTNGNIVKGEDEENFVKKMSKEEKSVTKVDERMTENNINKGTSDVRCLKEKKEIICGIPSHNGKLSASSKVDFGELEVVSGKKAKQRQPEGSKASLADNGNESKKMDGIQPKPSVKEIDTKRPKTDVQGKKHEKEQFGGTSFKKKSSSKRKFREGSDQLQRNNEDSVEHVKRSKTTNTSPSTTLPEGTGQLALLENKDSTDDEEIWSSEFEVGYHDTGVTRTKVKETLRLYQLVCRKLLQSEEAKSDERRVRVDLRAAKILKDKKKYVNTGKQIIGHVPGVEVGDEFLYRVELTIIGLHRQIQAGIDYLKQDGKLQATSIVASGGYDDDLENSDVLIYTGQGGNVTGGDKQPEDQKLERGNLALANCRDTRSPVRVIRGESKTSNSSDARGKTYVYDGLYLVQKYWQELGPHGKLVFKFKMVRIPGQPELAWRLFSNSNKKSREGICMDDISQGREVIPICAVNTIDNEKPPPFKYTKSMIYPVWCRPIPPKGCECTNGCSESPKCPCVMKNGGEIPFNHNGAIVQAKNLVYECGPNCKCPPSCHNRVSQHGIRFQLEIFKTKSKGWGVRSLNSIPSGSFICEYTGELLEDKEAERRTGNDEYLFDIGNKYDDDALRTEISTVMPDAISSSAKMVDCGFTIDAAEFGNVGRFINHSCSPNLYAQNVLYDHEDNRLPHIMFFATDNIPPLQELVYDYNYAIDQVRDSNGNVKTKSCHCGSSECTGRMY